MSAKSKIDQLEATLAEMPRVEVKISHRFTPGMYVREMTLPAGTALTSMKHKTEHPFVISKGCVYVTHEDGTREVLEAPFTGTTTMGTRRAIYAESETVWTTFHATTETDIEKIGLEILEPNENPLLTYTPEWLKSLPY